MLNLSGHPYEPLMAVSGIDYSIKIFSPDNRAQENAEKGIDIGSKESSDKGFGNSGLPYGRQRHRRHHHDNEANDDIAASSHNENQGLASRKRMAQSYQILAQNDVSRQGGRRDAFFTVGPFPRVQTVGIRFSEWIAWINGVSDEG